jgi:hypothetical protein
LQSFFFALERFRIQTLCVPNNQPKIKQTSPNFSESLPMMIAMFATNKLIVQLIYPGYLFSFGNMPAAAQRVCKNVDAVNTGVFIV